MDPEARLFRANQAAMRPLQDLQRIVDRELRRASRWLRGI
uniref:Uncharacterized protein n=1 Tax=Spironucleus salmonicida TaxID=348837 RepID=V6LAJ5_9EUKA|eukprot:EST41480.1 Hypothetical protein SS50377_fx011 [Spironucleus salmonicida]